MHFSLFRNLEQKIHQNELTMQEVEEQMQQQLMEAKMRQVVIWYIKMSQDVI